MARFDTYANKPAPVSNDTVLIYDSENGNNKQVKMIDLALALDSMSGINIPAGTDLNDLTAPGFYACVSTTVASSLVNCPLTANFSMLVMKKTHTLYNQIIFSGSPTPRIYLRTKTNSGWQPWKRMAILEEDVDPLAEKLGKLKYLDFSILQSETRTLTLPIGLHCKMIITSVSQNVMAEVLITTTSTGVIKYVEITKGSDVTIDYSVKSKLTITNGSTAAALYPRFLIFGSKTITMDEDPETTTESTT